MVVRKEILLLSYIPLTEFLKCFEQSIRESEITELQRSIQKSFKHLRWSFLRKYLMHTFQPVTIFAKRSISVVLQGSEYASVLCY